MLTLDEDEMAVAKLQILSVDLEMPDSRSPAKDNLVEHQPYSLFNNTALKSSTPV